VPELPEAELWRGPLASAVGGRRVAGFACSQPGFVRAPLRDPAAFAAGVAGRAVSDVERRGKRLLFRLGDGQAISLSMGLWARLELRTGPLEPLQGAQLEFGAGGAAVGDAAAAGSVFLAITEIALANVSLGPYTSPPEPPPYDAFEPRLDGARLASLAAARGTVKAFLTDDRYVLGVGNGYSDELLWQARVHPRRPCGSLAAAEWAAVAEALRAVLTAAYDAGGESGFVGPGGRVGSYERVVHHHGGGPCPRCGSPLGSMMAGRRETNFCPVCQPS
jgi:formamidopyrimidine-DNA glycosylase